MTEQLAFPETVLPENRRPRISRDEMNLAEFPLTVLSTRADPGVKTLEFSDSVRMRNGELVQRKWIITGADKFGLPTASDDEVLLGLLKLTVEDGFRERKVYFTRYELLRILRWSTEGRNYVRLQKALDRLSGVRIKASNAFFDNETKTHSTRNFGIVDAYEINDGRSTDPKPSFFTWSDVIFKSFQVGFIKKLDLEFYLDMQSAVSKRLYRFLDKHFWYRSTIQVNLFTLAHEKIGVSRNYRFASSLRQQLDPALDELIRKDFISSYEYIGRGKDTQISIRSASAKPRSSARSEVEDRTEVEVVAEKQIPQVVISESQRVQELLVQRGLNERQATLLVREKSDEVINRMKEIIAYFDRLVLSQSKLVSRSPIGFLYRAMEKPEQFILPGEMSPTGTQQPLGLNSEKAGKAALSSSNATKATFTKPSTSPRVVEKNSSSDKLATLEAQYLVERKREARRLREEVEPSLLQKITREVEGGLVKLRGIISDERFIETVNHGVEERLVKLFAFPEFDQWMRGKRMAPHH